jgi:hypothetical protein
VVRSVEIGYDCAATLERASATPDREGGRSWQCMTWIRGEHPKRIRFTRETMRLNATEGRQADDTFCALLLAK